MAKLPIRSKRFGVGKEIGGAVYVHCSYEDVLPQRVQCAKGVLPDAFEYTVVKFDLRSERTSYVCSPDFDTADEPRVGDIVVVSPDDTIKRIKQLQDPYIYHHKWLFVRDDYAGFDVSSSIARSERWLNLSGVDTKRIGRASYWQQNVVPRLTDDHDGWLRSAEVCEELRISTCELSHRRNAGEIAFKKQGNTYYYQLDKGQ